MTTQHILDGLRIIDLTSGLPGAMATRMLAESGADVVKVEPPTGDPLRARSAFATWNRSKRSVIVDLDTDEGLEQLQQLLAATDVFIHDYPPTRAAASGLDDKTLAASHPGLIVCSILGYPINHPDCERPAHDLLVQARSGMMSEIWGNREGPIAMRFPLPSWAAASLAAAGITARLILREQSGRGGAVHTSLLQGMLNTISLAWNRAENPIAELISTKDEAPPQLAMYECSDGVWLQMMNPGERINIAAIPLIRDAVAQIPGGCEISGFTSEALRSVIVLKSSTEWLPAFREADLAVEPCLPLGEVLRHPAVIDNDYTVEVVDPEWGRTLQAGFPFSTQPPSEVRSPAPKLGEHNKELIADHATPFAAYKARLAVASPAKETSAPGLPLAGVKVLDLGSFLAGPMAPMLMADLGADVIKVEPVEGDRLRYKPVFWEACSRNKRAIAVDLTTREGKEVLRRLIEWADVVHHNQRPKAAAKLGIDEAGLRSINPDIVFSYVTSYGERGSRSHSPGFDSIFQALGGWNLENGGEGGTPQFSRLGVLDIQTALLSLVGTLLAVYHKQRTGKPGKVSTSLLCAAVTTQSETLIQLADDAVAPYLRFDSSQTGYGPGHRIYQTSDGWVAVVCENKHQLAQLRSLAASSEDSGITEGLATQKTQEVLDALENRGIAAELVREEYGFDFFDDPDNHNTGLIAGYPHAQYGYMEQPGAYWNFDDVALRMDRAAPIIGQHTREILSELGYPDADIDQLCMHGATAGPTTAPTLKHP